MKKKNQSIKEKKEWEEEKLQLLNKHQKELDELENEFREEIKEIEEYMQ